MTASMTFLPGVGFRNAGLRLESPVRMEQEGRTLTVRAMVCTPDGTDLMYDITDGTQGFVCVVPGTGPNVLDTLETVMFRDGENEYRGALPSSSRIIAGGVSRVLRARPLPAGLRRVELRLASPITGEWSVLLDLVPFGSEDDGQLQPLEVSATHEGITIVVRGMSATSDATAVRFDVVGDSRVQRVVGVGGLGGMRQGPTSLRLRDERGRTYEEVPQEGAADQMGRSELAVFEPLAADAREFELEVPFVFAEETEAPVVVRLPVTAPAPVMLGPYPIRVISSGEAPDSRRRRNFGPALAIGLDLGGWQGDRRVLHPSGVLVDGQNRGMGYGNGINATAPEPLDVIEVRLKDPLAVALLTLIGPTTQVRGPWRVKWARATP